MRNLRQADGWDVVHGGCILIRWRNRDTHQVLTQRKRRPAGAELGTCTWHPSVHCDDHPSRGHEPSTRSVSSTGTRGRPV